jgi:hypothetical protein
MADKDHFVAAMVGLLGRQDLFKNLASKVADAGEVLISSEQDGVRYTIQTRFQLSDIGVAPREITHWLRVKSVEKPLEAIARRHGLQYDYDTQHTLAAGIRNKELYRRMVSGTLDVGPFMALFEKYLQEEIVEFFKGRNTPGGLAALVRATDFGDVIKIGIGGEYPVNVLKAIAIAHHDRNGPRYVEFKQGLQTWIDEDRKDPKYSPRCDSYQGALDELVAQLEA